MSFVKAMQQRYTTKNYDASKKITPKKIEELKEVVRLSPSSINSQPWRFTFVSDKETKERLSKVSWLNTDRILNCDTVVVFSRIDSISRFEEQIERELPKGAVGYYKEFIKPWPESRIKSWFDRQVYLSLGVLLSACANMGIDATPMEGIEPEKYDEILDHNDYAAIVAVAIGHRTEDDFNQPHLKPKSRMDLDRIVETI
ncbi:nitroreductase family protein [Maribacter sp. 2307UL18-2]|uniref:nitroreductase family protein n=1 Tax=Maribacter sp. 2307UL18-2 TaxID=3386274 RepID=UPI0039BCC940